MLHEEKAVEIGEHPKELEPEMGDEEDDRSDDEEMKIGGKDKPRKANRSNSWNWWRWVVCRRRFERIAWLY